mmetsp:Transcript_39443/g.93438  ORF Transcript_39443/g.93438 Transcript_39443/m.93438 type:complete len:215 (-) Transcript_39443:2158-2802(-)
MRLDRVGDAHCPAPPRLEHLGRGFPDLQPRLFAVHENERRVLAVREAHDVGESARGDGHDHDPAEARHDRHESAEVRVWVEVSVADRGHGDEDEPASVPHVEVVCLLEGALSVWRVPNLSSDVVTPRVGRPWKLAGRHLEATVEVAEYEDQDSPEGDDVPKSIPRIECALQRKHRPEVDLSKVGHGVAVRKVAQHPVGVEPPEEVQPTHVQHRS